MHRERTILFHTSSKIIPSINARFSDYMNRNQVQHFVDEAMLELLKEEGFASEITRDIVAAHLTTLERYRPDRILCTCTTLSPVIRGLRDRYSMPISTVDEHMIARLDRVSRAPLLVLTSPSTTDATMNEFATLCPDCEVHTIFVEAALEARLKGDIETHNALLADSISSQTGDFDAIVLPQSSMLVALDPLRSHSSIPVFNGLESAISYLMECS